LEEQCHATSSATPTVTPGTPPWGPSRFAARRATATCLQRPDQRVRLARERRVVHFDDLPAACHATSLPRGPHGGQRSTAEGQLLGRQQPVGLRTSASRRSFVSSGTSSANLHAAAPFRPPIHPARAARGRAGVYILRCDGAAAGHGVRRPVPARCSGAAPRGATRSAARNAHDESRRRY
jgi:hypothetical protein